MLKISIVFILLLAIACEEKLPTQIDGETEVNVLVLWNDSTNPEVINYVPLANAEMIFVSEYGKKSYFADENGLVKLINVLPSSVYQISARKNYNYEASNIIVGNIQNLEINSGTPVYDTIYAKPISASGISINEIYCGGPITNRFYFKDQFIELYNSSKEVKYLDGMLVCRFSLRINNIEVSGRDLDDDGDIDGVIMAFKFPGKAGGIEHPFHPQTFLTLAIDAKDHRKDYENSIDLSNADWEFVNQFNSIDFDNKNVPNLETLMRNKTSDFKFHLTSDVVVITNGMDTIWEDGIDIETILDGIEYQSNPSQKSLDKRIDLGWVQSTPKYNGESMQRREKGIDTNDGTLDWVILPSPTPGWQ